MCAEPIDNINAPGVYQQHQRMGATPGRWWRARHLAARAVTAVGARLLRPGDGRKATGARRPLGIDVDLVKMPFPRGIREGRPDEAPGHRRHSSSSSAPAPRLRSLRVDHVAPVHSELPRAPSTPSGPPPRGRGRTASSSGNPAGDRRRRTGGRPLQGASASSEGRGTPSTPASRGASAMTLRRTCRSPWCSTSGPGRGRGDDCPPVLRPVRCPVHVAHVGTACRCSRSSYRRRYRRAGRPIAACRRENDPDHTPHSDSRCS